MHLFPSVAEWPNLELKTRPKQLLGSLPLVIALPGLVQFLTLKNAFNQKQLSAFFHWSQFTELNFCQVYPAGFAGQGILNKDFNPLAR